MFGGLIGQDCYSGATAGGDRKDEALFTEFINKNDTFQTNKVSLYVKYRITVSKFFCTTCLRSASWLSEPTF